MAKPTFVVTKWWRDLPAAHRQPTHDGHCRLVHGHNWAFEVTFSATQLDENGFVIDVGKLGKVTERLKALFDHTLLINGEDPQLEVFKEMDRKGLISLVVVRNCGMEALAELVAYSAQVILEGNKENSDRGVKVVEVTCWEDSKNRATYRP